MCPPTAAAYGLNPFMQVSVERDELHAGWLGLGWFFLDVLDIVSLWNVVDSLHD